jgi:methanogenic corrinoid protein MtbC1
MTGDQRDHSGEGDVSEPNHYLAEMMRVSAPAYAAHAAERLLEKHPACAERFGDSAFPDWQASLVQRLNELAVAVEMEEPTLFRSQVEWTRDAFAARSVPVEDVARSLRALHATLQQDLPEGVGEIPGPYIESALAALGEPSAVDTALSGEGEALRIAHDYVETAVAGDQRGAARVVMDSVGNNGMSTHDVIEKVLLPAQVEIGRLWHLGEIGIAEEHAATATTCTVMSILTWRDAGPPGDAPLVLLAGVEGDRHDVGLRATACLLELGGCRPVLLGADVPSPEIVRAVSGADPDVVILSATLSVHLRPLRRAIRSLRDLESGANLHILVGGPAIGQVPHLAARLEADGHVACPGDAVRAACGDSAVD